MDSRLSDRVPVIIVFVIGVILFIDLVNVFFIGGPSFFSLIFKSGNAASGSGSSPAVTVTEKSSVVNVQASPPPGSVIFVPTMATPVPVVSYVSVVTPIVTQTDDLTTFLRTPPTVPVTPEQDTYIYIYSGNLSYLSGESPTAVAFDVKEPPLVINYNVIPVIVKDSKVAVNRSAKKELRTDMMINFTYPSPDSSFFITIYDRKSGEKIAQDGYGRLYGLIPQKTFIVREVGSYIVQFEGSESEAHVDMLLKREGNIV